MLLFCAPQVLTASIGAISKSIEGLSSKLKCHTQLLVEMGADSGANESNIMIYLGIVEQRANELLASYINLQQHGTTYGEGGGGLSHSATAPGPSGLLVGPHTPANLPPPSITVPTTAEDFESDDSEEDDEHPLTRDELHAKTMRGLAKREASTARKGNKAAAKAAVRR